MEHSLRRPTPEALLEHSLDITEPCHGVDVQIRADGKVLWVNVDGVCVLRICRITNLKLRGKQKDKK
jgi:hypothetical protein